MTLWLCSWGTLLAHVIGSRIQAYRVLNLVFYSQANAQITIQLHNSHRAVIVPLSHITGVSLILWTIRPLRTAGPLLQLQLKSLRPEGEEEKEVALCQGVSSWLTLAAFWWAHTGFGTFSEVPLLCVLLTSKHSITNSILKSREPTCSKAWLVNSQLLRTM